MISVCRDKDYLITVGKLLLGKNIEDIISSQRCGIHKCRIIWYVIDLNSRFHDELIFLCQFIYSSNVYLLIYFEIWGPKIPRSQKEMSLPLLNLTSFAEKKIYIIIKFVRRLRTSLVGYFTK